MAAAADHVAAKGRAIHQDEVDYAAAADEGRSRTRATWAAATFRIGDADARRGRIVTDRPRFSPCRLELAFHLGFAAVGSAADPAFLDHEPRHRRNGHQ